MANVAKATGVDASAIRTILVRSAPSPAFSGDAFSGEKKGARESDVNALVEALRVHPDGLRFQDLRAILDRDTQTWHRLVKRALQKRRVYRTGSSSSLRYHAST